MPNSPSNKVILPRAPTLYAIIAVKLFKGIFFAILAIIVYKHSDNDVTQEVRNLLHWLKLNPEGKFWANLLVQTDNLTEPRMIHIAYGTLIYSFFALVEGVGLMYRLSWAGWLSIGESAFFIPIEVYELSRKFTGFVFVIMIVNTFMVWYLFQNRERLFRHHSRG